MNEKKTIRINESQINSIIENSLRKIFKESVYKLNESEFDMQTYPDDVYEWGRKVQELGLELSRLCGKYRFEDEDLYNTLSEIEKEYNTICGDLNSYDIASHWNS